MKWTKLYVLIFLTLAIVSIPTITKARENIITIQHRFIEALDTEMGTDVTLEMTVTNRGLDALSNITLEQIEPLDLISPAGQQLTIGDLNAGASSTVSWTITTPPSNKELIALELERVMVVVISTDEDENGIPLHFLATSVAVRQ